MSISITPKLSQEKELVLPSLFLRRGKGMKIIKRKSDNFEKCLGAMDGSLNAKITLLGF
jgi:hypothetical protein